MTGERNAEALSSVPRNGLKCLRTRRAVATKRIRSRRWRREALKSYVGKRSLSEERVEETEEDDEVLEELGTDARVEPGQQTSRRSSFPLYSFPFSFRRVPFLQSFVSHAFPSHHFFLLSLLFLLLRSSSCSIILLLPAISFFARYFEDQIASRLRRRSRRKKTKGMLLGPRSVRRQFVLTLVIVRRLRDGPPWFTSRGSSPLFFDGCCNSLIFVFATRDSRREQIHRYPQSFPTSACLMFGQHFHWICSPTSAHERRVASASLLYRKTDRNPNNRTSKKSC